MAKASNIPRKMFLIFKPLKLFVIPLDFEKILNKPTNKINISARDCTKVSFIFRTTKTPSAAPRKVKGNKYFNSLKFILLFLPYSKELISVPEVEQNLFVPKANLVGSPTSKKAGRLIKPPPPAIESTAAAIKPNTHNSAKVLRFIWVNMFFASESTG